MFLEASAKQAENVEEAFVNIAAQVLSKVKDGTFRMDDEVRMMYALWVMCMVMSMGMGMDVLRYFFGTNI